MRSPIWVALGGLLLCACEVSSAPPARIWTSADFINASRNGGSILGIDARFLVAPAGEPIARLSPPFSDREVAQQADADGMAIVPSFAQGHAVAYAVTEFWIGYEEVWVQPLYTLVTDFDGNGPGQPTRLEGARSIFSVGVDSTFYSPFWEVHWVLVPPDTDPEKYTSAEAILSAGLPMRRGPGSICAIVPEGTRAAVAEGNETPIHPLTGEPVKAPFSGKAWVDGEEVGVLAFGTNRFVWDENLVVAEEPLFRFVHSSGDGTLTPLDLPTVGGTGPVGSSTPPRLVQGRPAFGSLWRIWDVELPTGAAPFIPESLAALRADFNGRNVSTPPVDADIEARDDVGDYTLRVARNPECFADAAAFPDSCEWIDSQAALEAAVPEWAIHRTPVLATCPFVHYRGEAVP